MNMNLPKTYKNNKEKFSKCNNLGSIVFLPYTFSVIFTSQMPKIWIQLYTRESGFLDFGFSTIFSQFLTNEFGWANVFLDQKEKAFLFIIMSYCLEISFRAQNRDKVTL
jgi:hypothetical protein